MNTDNEKDKNALDDGYNDSANWKWGLFYFNPKDKRIFPPKRWGIGWTINFGNPYSVIVFVLVIVLAILAPLLLNTHPK